MLMYSTMENLVEYISITNLFIFQQGCIKLIKSGNKDFYIATKKIIFQINSVLNIHQRTLKKCITFPTNMMMMNVS